MRQANQERADPWRIESESILCGLTDHVYDLAGCVELPAELRTHEAATDHDPQFSECVDEWFDFLCEKDLLLPIERPCDAQGLLLHWDMRAVRLLTLPAAQLASLHFFFEHCPRHIRALLIQQVYWLVLFERVRRRGTAVWSAVDVVDPEPEPSAFFRPNRLTIRRPLRPECAAS